MRCRVIKAWREKILEHKSVGSSNRTSYFQIVLERSNGINIGSIGIEWRPEVGERLKNLTWVNWHGYG